MVRFIESPLFKQKVGEGSFGDALLKLSEPLARELLEIQELIENRHLKSIDFDEYMQTIPQDNVVYAEIHALAKKLAVSIQPANTLMAAFKQTSPYTITLRDSMSDTYDPNVSERQRTIAMALLNEVVRFNRAYTEMVYARSAVHQLLQKLTNETKIVGAIKMQEPMWKKLLHDRRPRTNAIADWIEVSAGGFTETYREFMRSISTDSIESPSSRTFEQIRSMLDSGHRIVPASTQLDAAGGVLRLSIEPVPEDPQSDTRVETVAVIRIHSDKGQLHFFIDTDSGELYVPGTSVPLGVILPEKLAQNFTKKVYLSIFEAMERGGIERPAPVAQTRPEREDDTETEVRRPGRLLRDISGSQFIDILRRMNRSYLLTKGADSETLEKESEPRLRQKGSHAIVYCAATGRIAPVPVHSTALPIGTLRNVLRILQLSPEDIESAR